MPDQATSACAALRIVCRSRAIAASYNEFLLPLAFGGSTPENLWLAMTRYYQHLEMDRSLYQEYLRRTGNVLPRAWYARATPQ